MSPPFGVTLCHPPRPHPGDTVPSVPRAGKKEKASDPVEWSVRDVVDYFTEAGFPEQATAFQEQVGPCVTPPHTRVTPPSVPSVPRGCPQGCPCLFHRCPQLMLSSADAPHLWLSHLPLSTWGGGVAGGGGGVSLPPQVSPCPQGCPQESPPRVCRDISTGVPTDAIPGLVSCVCVPISGCSLYPLKGYPPTPQFHGSPPPQGCLPGVPPRCPHVPLSLRVSPRAPPPHPHLLFPIPLTTFPWSILG